MINYSDGKSSELGVLKLIQEAKELSSSTPIAVEHYAEWPVRYHLTPERSNLVRHLCFNGLDVLELGAGMGGVSRYLAENVASLTVVEGTEIRFEALSARLRDLKNWSGQVANIQDAKIDKQFDVICVVGVLEYAELYWKAVEGKSPFYTFLNHLKQWLKPEGVLVLAIENRLGIKYWTGAAEDHTGRMFDGTAGYSLEKTQRTFSRKELLGVFNDADFGVLEEFYPFPDYKIPSSVISRRLSATAPLLAVNIATSQSFENYMQPRVQLYPETLTLESLASAGLVEEFANSFLFVATLEGKETEISQRLLGRLSDKEVAWHYSKNRRCPVLTTFTKGEDEEILVRKASLLNESTLQNWKAAGVEWTAPKSEAVSIGRKAVDVFRRKAYFEGADRGFSYFLEFLRCGIKRFEDEVGLNLQGKALDGVLTNAVSLPENEFDFFDLEWSSLKPLTKSYWVFRNVFLLRNEREFLVGNSYGSSLKEIYSSVCNRLGIEADYETDSSLESEFQSQITWISDSKLYLDTIHFELETGIPPNGWVRRPSEEVSRRAAEILLQRNYIKVAVKLATRLHQFLMGHPDLFKFLKRSFFVLSDLQKKLKHFRTGRQVQELREGWNLIRIDVPSATEEVLLHFKVREIEVSAVSQLKRLGKFESLIKLTENADGLRVECRPNGEPVKIRGRSLHRLEGGIRLLFPLFLKLLVQPAALREFIQSVSKRASRYGLKGVISFLQEKALSGELTRIDYFQPWIKNYDVRSLEQKNAIRSEIRAFEFYPLISVMMPVYNSEEEFLRKAIQSVLNQLYPNWELCIADDASTKETIRPLLEEYAKKDPRIRVVYRETNGHLSIASQTALDLAAGSYVAFLDHDDELSEHALYEVVKELNRFPKTKLIFSDEDKIDTRGNRFDPHFKSEFNRHIFYSYNQLTHLTVVERRRVQELGGFRIGFEGAQDYDLFLRMLENLSQEEIRHIPKLLYHWRVVPGSTAGSSEAKAYAPINAKKALEAHFERTKNPAEVIPIGEGNFRVRYQLPATLPRVSVVIGTRDKVELLKGIVSGLLQETNYDNLEIIIVDNGSKEVQTLSYFESLRKETKVKVISYPHAFNFSAINNFGVSHATGELIALLNNDLRVIHSDWLQEMVSYFTQSSVGAVGAKLYYPNDRVQHAGVVLGLGQLAGEAHGVAGHSHRNARRGDRGYMRRLLVHQNVSCVTAACVLVRRSVFRDVGGFDEKEFPVAFNDVDLCLKIRKLGYEIIWTPFAELYHLESASRGSDLSLEKRDRFERECSRMMSRWKKELLNDPYYSPNLTLEREDFSYAFPPRIKHSEL